MDNFTEKCSAVVADGKREIKEKLNEIVNRKVGNELEKCYKDEINKINKEFVENSRAFGFPLNIETEYKNQIESNFKRIFENYMFTWDSYYMNERTKAKIVQDKEHLVEIVSDMIMRGEDSTSATFTSTMNAKIDEINSKFEDYLNKLYESDNDYAKMIQQIYNENHRTYAFDSGESKFDLVGQIYGLDDYINKCKNSDTCFAIDQLYYKKWFKKVTSNFIRIIALIYL